MPVTAPQIAEAVARALADSFVRRDGHEIVLSGHHAQHLAEEIADLFATPAEPLARRLREAAPHSCEDCEVGS